MAAKQGHADVLGIIPEQTNGEVQEAVDCIGSGGRSSELSGPGCQVSCTLPAKIRELKDKNYNFLKNTGYIYIYIHKNYPEYSLKRVAVKV